MSKLVIAVATAMLVLGATYTQHDDVRAAGSSRLTMGTDADGHYRMTFDDPDNEWRCSRTVAAPDAFNVTCRKK